MSIPLINDTLQLIAQYQNMLSKKGELKLKDVDTFTKNSTIPILSGLEEFQNNFLTEDEIHVMLSILKHQIKLSGLLLMDKMEDDLLVARQIMQTMEMLSPIVHKLEKILLSITMNNYVKDI